MRTHLYLIRFLIGISIILATMTGAAAAQDAPGYAIIELSSPAAVNYRGGIRGLDATAAERGRFDATSAAYAAYRRHLENEHAGFQSAMSRVAPQATVVRSFYATANAVAVRLNGADAAVLARINGVKRVFPDALYQQALDESVGLIHADDAWSEPLVMGRATAGYGVRVGIIDSGNVNSLIPGYQPFFNCKSVEFGGFFYRGVTGLPAIGIKNDNGALPAPGVAYVSDHGTHVAGIVGGCVMTINDGSVWDETQLSGVAPGATLVDYNVFPGIGAGWTAFDGSALSHDIADAIETSVLAGDDVINMSLGGGAQGPNDFLAEVANAAFAAGVVVVASAGNEGPGLFTVGSPGTAADVLTVGASTNTRGIGILVFAPGFSPINAFPGEFPNFDGTSQVLIDWPGSDNLACDSDVAAGSLAGEVVLIERGTCTFSQKVANAKAAGSGGVLVFTDDRPAGGMARTDGFDDELPAVMIERAPGLALESALAGGPLSPVVITPATIVPETPNELADFSSRGPADFTGIVKPDVVAPGVNILSSVFSGFELFDGTSMASPHVAGAAAILRQAQPGWTPAQVKSALATTATSLGLAPWEQGSGLINVDAALAANAFFAPTNASFGVFEGKAPADGTVEIAVDTAASCSVSSVSGSFASASLAGDALTVTFSGGRAAPTGLHGGFVEVDCSGQMHTIPWAAVVDRK